MSGEPAEPLYGPEDELWLTPVALAEREGCSRSTIWRWVRRGLVERRALGPRTGVQLRLRPPGAVRVNPESWAARCPLCGASAGPPPADATWRTVSAFCAHYRVSRSTVRRWRASGLLGAQSIDGRLRVRLLDERARWGL